ncbi:zinc-dependent alcohol dehydrogenase [Halanaerobium kushneri]|jgi:L-iditol 2-dehydrogenase|uniref:L-iditol 2-dehydrogenase n=1 Tax=Halanaerobium kushneri TaxID=56779 RepID=A0A1N6ZHK6_9FIRM|nr:alcohol dehydrogenase catalytic domain-containing protein [Halanaerobium kushneri]SIR26370.1 L-iditol 2-dehydrogenase [Halanaerobium kushneri]
MKAARLKSLKNLEVVEMDKPELQAGEVLVRVKSGGICGTDMHIFAKENAFSHHLGHELSGEVVENRSEEYDFKQGDRVVIDNATNCGVCKFCKNGQPEYCSDIRNLLMEERLSFQEYVAVPARSLYKFKDLSFQAAALAEPFTVALEMIATAEVEAGQDIAVFGPGPIGLMAAAYARHIGVNKIYLTGRSHSKKRLELGRKIGVDEIIEVDQEDTVEFFKERNLKLDRVLITAPPYTIKDAVQILRFGGILTYIGFSFDGRENVELNFNDIHLNKLQIRATHAIPNRFFPAALENIKKGVINAEDFISREFMLADVQKAFEFTLDNETIKTLINID